MLGAAATAALLTSVAPIPNREEPHPTDNDSNDKSAPPMQSAKAKQDTSDPKEISTDYKAPTGLMDATEEKIRRIVLWELTGNTYGRDEDDDDCGGDEEVASVASVGGDDDDDEDDDTDDDEEVEKEDNGEDDDDGEDEDEAMEEEDGNEAAEKEARRSAAKVVRIASALEELCGLLQAEKQVPTSRAGQHPKSPTRALMEKYEAGVAVLAVLKSHAHIPRVLIEGVLFLTYWIGWNEEVARNVLQMDGALVVVRALRTFTGHAALLWTLKVLHMIYSNADSDEKRRFVHSFLGLPPVMGAMLQYPESFELQNRAVAILAMFHSVEDLRPDLVRAGALSPVVAAAERHGSESEYLRTEAQRVACELAPLLGGGTT
jgi:hypothetical protein